MEIKFIGVDVSKDWLDIACANKVTHIDNKKSAIRGFLKTLPKGSVVAMESTNIYHLMLADLCYSAGMAVYVVNPRVTKHYQEALTLRGSSDKISARALASYIQYHHQDLRRYVPKSADQRRLQTLIRRRAKLVGVSVQMRQSMQQIKEIKSDIEAIITRLDKLIEKIDQLIDLQLEGSVDRERIAGIKGIGPVASAALVADLQAGDFLSADAFVAFYGLDPQPKDSGKSIGRRKISKRGQRLGRSLLYTAAMAAARSKAWKPVYANILLKGLTKVQALVCLARKIARTVWSIYTHRTQFDPQRIAPKSTNSSENVGSAIEQAVQRA